MAFELLKYEAGRPQQGAAPTSRGAKIAGILSKLTDSIQAEGRHQELVEIREAKKAAMNDITQDTIDPFKELNDLAYSTTVVRTNTFAAKAVIKNAISAGEFDDVKPKDFTDLLAKEHQNWYKTNANHEFSEARAEVYSKITLANQQELVAMQASRSKAYTKARTGEEFLKQSLAIPTSVPPEQFADNYKALINDSLGTMTKAEQDTFVMSAAIASAEQGDRRLLDFAIKENGAAAIVPEKVALAEQRFDKAVAAEQKQYWALETIARDKLATDGEYDRSKILEDISNPIVLDAIGLPQMRTWFSKSETSRVNKLTINDFVKDIENGVPMQDATEKQVSDSLAIRKDQLLMSDPKNPEGAMQKYVQEHAAQGVVDQRQKAVFNSYIGRPILNGEAVDTTEYKQQFTLMAVYEDYMKPDQFISQVGSDAYDNYILMKDALDTAGHDNFKEAGDSVAATTKAMIARGDTKGFALRDQAVSEGIAEILAGNAEFSDPEISSILNSWGLGKGKTADSMFTGMIGARLRRAAEIMIRKGMSPEAAMERAILKESANFKVFGNELHYTPHGQDIATKFGYPANLPIAEMDKTLDWYVRIMGKEHDLKKGLPPGRNLTSSDVHLQTTGNSLTFTDKEGNEYPPVPIKTLGEIYQGFEELERRNKPVVNQPFGVRWDLIKNDNFRGKIVKHYGEESQSVFLVNREGEEITLEKYDMADNDQRTKWNKEWYNEHMQFTVDMFKFIGWTVDWWADLPTRSGKMQTREWREEQSKAFRARQK